MTIVCFNIFPMVERSNIRFYRDGNFFLAMHKLHQYIVRSFFLKKTNWTFAAIGVTLKLHHAR